MDLELTTAAQFGLPLGENQPMLQWGTTRGRSHFRLHALGDVSLGARLRRHCEKPASVLSPELHLLLGTSDSGFANLECAFSRGDIDGPFVAPVEAAEILAQLKASHLHLANNHIYDAGSEGFASTLHILKQQDTLALGADTEEKKAAELTISEHRGVRTGWLACGRTGLDLPADRPRYLEFDREEILALARAARDSVDALIVSLHLGFMYVDYPDPEHRALAHDLVAAGAKLVLMHHPHVLQGIERVGNDGIICYSLGNFLVDWTAGYLKHDIRTREQTEGAVFLFDINTEGVARMGIVPTRISGDCRVELATGERGRSILERVERVSRELTQDYLPTYRQQRATYNTTLGLRTLLSTLRHEGLLSFARKLRRVRLVHFFMLARWAMGSR